MEYSFEVIAKITLEYQIGDTSSTHKASDLALCLSENLNKEKYLDKNGLPTEEGVQAATLVLISALSANIHYSHQKKYWDSAKHLRHIISELEKQFTLVADVSKGTIVNKKN